jgi:Spy/CpxP family protein refolding chaperone
MKLQITTTLIFLMLTGAIFCLPCPADEKGAGGWGENAQAQPPRDANKGKRFEKLRERFEQAVKPTAEQQPQLEQIFRTHQQEVRNWTQQHSKQIQAAKEKLRAARKADDEQALKAAREEFRKLFETRRALVENLQKQLGEVLTKEQMAKAKEIFRPQRRRNGRAGRERGPGEMLKKLDLTEAQEAKIRDILKEAKAEVQKTDDKTRRRDIFREACEEINKTVLTEEQREKAKKHRQEQHNRRRKMMKKRMTELGMSEQQLAQTEEIINEARKAAKEAKDPQERREILRSARKKVREEVMTDEQRAKADKMRKKRGRRCEKDRQNENCRGENRRRKGRGQKTGKENN